MFARQPSHMLSLLQKTERPEHRKRGPHSGALCPWIVGPRFNGRQRNSSQFVLPHVKNRFGETTALKKSKLVRFLKRFVVKTQDDFRSMKGCFLLADLQVVPCQEENFPGKPKTVSCSLRPMTECHGQFEFLSLFSNTQQASRLSQQAVCTKVSQTAEAEPVCYLFMQSTNASATERRTFAGSRQENGIDILRSAHQLGFHSQR